MKNFAGYFYYFFFWILFFVVARGFFLIYHLHLADGLSAGDIIDIFWYGLRMDASFAGYLSILPFLLLFIKSLSPSFKVRKIIRVYTIILIVILSFLTMADLELYTAWGFRMDATPLQYFKTPEEMAGTISSAPIFILLLIFAFLCFIFIYLYRFFYSHITKKVRHFSIIDSLLSLLFVAILFIPIRGGIQKIPLNISDVYFSDNLFADHAAINLPWNIAFSILNKSDQENPYQYFDDNEAERLVKSLYNTGRKRIPFILSTQQPDIIFVILESFTAKFVGCLGGEKGVTPQLDAIAKDGLLFTNIYAAGDRSEKGQVAILSGYPNQAINSIIKTPTKTRALPSIAQTLSSYSYYCNYTYGGELEFANIKSYLINTGYKHLVSKYSFPVSQRTTSWGVHDQYVYERFFNDLKTQPEPYFSTLFSLSSHEPYDVPLNHFPGKQDVVMFKNSIYYADSVLGDFIAKLKTTSSWNKTLVVIVADHGHPMPGHDAVDQPSKFHIPLVFTGGALTLKGKIDNIGSQTDIATTVLDQLHISTEKFKWGKDLLDSAAKQFAFYNFNNGFGFVTPSGFATMDNISKKIIRMSPGFDTSNLKYGKAYMQFSYADYLKR